MSFNAARKRVFVRCFVLKPTFEVAANCVGPRGFASPSNSISVGMQPDIGTAGV